MSYSVSTTAVTSGVAANNALTCTSATAIGSCISGYVLLNNYCAACPSNTAACSSSTFTVAVTTCAYGYYPSSATACTACTAATALY